MVTFHHGSLLSSVRCLVLTKINSTTSQPLDSFGLWCGFNNFHNILQILVRSLNFQRRFKCDNDQKLDVCWNRNRKSESADLFTFCCGSWRIKEYFWSGKYSIGLVVLVIWLMSDNSTNCPIWCHPNLDPALCSNIYHYNLSSLLTKSGRHSRCIIRAKACDWISDRNIICSFYHS